MNMEQRYEEAMAKIKERGLEELIGEYKKRFPWHCEHAHLAGAAELILWMDDRKKEKEKEKR